MERPQLLSPTTTRWMLVCLAIVHIVYLRVRSLRGDLVNVWFVDAVNYADGIRYFRHGLSPYSVPGAHFFVYPPVFALAGSWLAQLLTPTVGWLLYISVHVACMAGLPWILAHFYLRPLRVSEATVLYLLGPLAYLEVALTCGNIAIACYVTAYFAGGYGILHRRWRWFYLVVVLASAIKITFFALLLLPLLAETGQILPSVLTAAATGGVYGLQRLIAPNLYGIFQTTLSQKTLIDRDYGDGIFGAVANLMKRFHSFSFGIPEAVYILAAGMICLTLFWLRRRRVDLKAPEWLALVIVAIALTNPRLKNYDALPALIPAWYLLVSTIRRPLTQVLTVISLAGFLIGHGPVGYIFLYGSAFIVGARSCISDGGREAPRIGGEESLTGVSGG